MYRRQCYEQLKMELPFGVELDKNNRWVKLAAVFPWKAIDEEYQKNFTSNEGQAAIPARLAFGALYIQICEGWIYRRTDKTAHSGKSISAILLWDGMLHSCFTV